MASLAHNPRASRDDEQLSGPRIVPTRPLIAPRLLRTAEAARYLGLGAKAIRRLILAGELPYVQMRPGNSPFLLDRRDLDRFIEIHKFVAGEQ